MQYKTKAIKQNYPLVGINLNPMAITFFVIYFILLGTSSCNPEQALSYLILQWHSLKIEMLLYMIMSCIKF